MHNKTAATFLALAGALTLGACVTATSTDEPDRRPVGADRICNAAAVQSHVGHSATQDMGAAILAQSGAAQLRWGAPGAAWTMDYRQDRVNVRYDNAMKITEVTCG